MPGVTVLPGELDPLQQGLLAGAKMAAVHHGIKHQQARNELLANQIELQERQVQIQEDLAPLRQSALQAEQRRDELATSMIQQQLDQNLPELQARAARGEITANELKTIAGVVGMYKDVSPSFDEAIAMMEFYKDDLAAAGVDVTPGNLRALADIAVNQAQVMADRLDLERRATEALEWQRRFQGLYYGMRGAGEVNPLVRDELDSLNTEERDLRQAIRGAEYLYANTTATDEKEQAKRDAHLKSLNEQLKDLSKRRAELKKQAALPPPEVPGMPTAPGGGELGEAGLVGGQPTIELNEQGLPIVRTAEQWKTLAREAPGQYVQLVDENGNSRTVQLPYELPE